jgi:predicted phosphodiesterase
MTDREPAIGPRPHAGRWPSTLILVLHVARVIVVGLLGGWLAVIFVGGVRVAAGPVTVRGEIRPAWSGRTRLDLPPVGSLSARTHRAPIAIMARVEEVHVAPLVRWAKDGVDEQMVFDWLKPNATRVAVALAWRSLLAALAGAAVFGLLAALRPRQWLACVSIGVGGVALPMALAAFTFNPDAFANARYSGELARAPALLRQFASLQGHIRVAAVRAEEFSQQLDNEVTVAPVPAESLTRVLLISDLHNNPAGLRLALDLAKAYEVKLVLVAGDISDLGHPLEGDLLSEWTRFRVPVVTVTGNHDSRAITGHLRKIKGITVLERGARVQHAGLTISGYGDPRAERDGAGDALNTPDELTRLFAQVRDDLQDAPTPDILLLHNHDVARRLLGSTPLILCGHSHAAMMRREGESVMVNAGTTGAAGVRYFTAKQQLAYGAAILSFVTENEPRLRYVDFIEVHPMDGSFVVQRRDLARWTNGKLFRLH